MADTDNGTRKRNMIIVVVAVLAVGILLLAVGRKFLVQTNRQRASRVVCGTVLYGMTKVLEVYAIEDAARHHLDAGRLPPGDQWCDSLMVWARTSPGNFVCRCSDAVEGESSYAINKHVAGKELEHLPDDVVLLFETDLGKDRRGRQEPIKNRSWYEPFLARNEPFRKRYPGTQKVYKNRWNQSGGPEILTTKHHNGQNCCVAFVSGRVAYVPAAEVSKLRWTTDPNDKDRFYKAHFYGRRMGKLAQQLIRYPNNDPQDRLPPADQWCDLLIAGGYCTFWSFFYEESDTVVGESDFAMNNNLAGRSLTGTPPDVVLLFETDFGKRPGARDGLLQNRASYDTFVSTRNEAFGRKYPGSRKVYKDRWNQAGGPEILATTRHDGEGCLLVFADTTVRFVETAELANLKWKAEQNSERFR